MQGSRDAYSSNSAPQSSSPSFVSTNLPPRPQSGSQQQPRFPSLRDRISRDLNLPARPSPLTGASITSALDPTVKGNRSTSPSQRGYARPARPHGSDLSPSKRQSSPSRSAPSKRRRIETRHSPSPRIGPSASTGSNAEPMPHGHRGHGRGRANGRNKTQAPPATVLPGPVHDRQQIMGEYGAGISIKQQWEENPKAPLANYLGGGSGGATNLGDGGKGFQVEEGVIDGRKMFRVSVLVDDQDNIVGVGDATSRKEAEKLAALSAVLQLTRVGYLEKGRAAAKNAPVAAAGGGGGSATPVTGSAETATLSDGSLLVYDRARQFMEWYCKKYNFGKPDIEFSSSATKVTAPSGFRGRKAKAAMGPTNWEAVMTVGDRRIGQGTASNKKGAQIRCYLDVVHYLESLDRDLWNDFIEATRKDPSAVIGQAPHLVFSMSDMLNDDIQTLCSDIRHSLLYYNAPQPNSSAPVTHVAHSFGPRRHWQATESELKGKSARLQDRLMQYETDPALEKMRATRQALPVYTRSSDVLAKIEVNDVTVVMAATGSGKTTQVPQMLFDDYINRGDGARCNIVCTQPRRLAAMSVAERVADERGQNLGQEVGYQVRFDNKPPQPNGSITFCTTGVFLKRMQSSLGAQAQPESVASMDQVTHVIVDEVHERDIDTDLLLVVLKRLIADRKARRKPIKVVLMSATIDPTLFQNYFRDDLGRPAPVAEVPGRTFPVSRHYLDDFLDEMRQGLPRNMGGWVFQDSKTSEYINREMSHDPTVFQQTSGIMLGELDVPFPLVALTIAFALKKSSDGHVLVFLPGWDEIKKVADILLDPGQYPLLGMNFNDASQFSVHYLHSSIPAAEQKEVFRPPAPGVRRIILATNIAETSVTIPDVVYVVDTGRVKEKRYDPERHMSSLVSAWVGASNLGQRAGRAGRHRSGEYYGILSKRRFASLEPNQMVEMKRSDLSDVVMHVKALNLGEVEEVLGAAIEPPEPSRIVAALETLHMLGALDWNKNLTSLGRVLLQLPTDAAIGKLCLYGSFFRCLDSALTLAAVLTNRDPFLAPLAMKREADEIKNSWSPMAFRSDPLAIVAAYNQWSAMDDRGEYTTANRFCQDNFLSKLTLLQIKQVKGHLLQSLDQAGVIAVSAGDRYVPRGFRGRAEVPMVLRENDNSLPLLAALIAVAGAPNFAIRTSDKTCRTSQDKTVFIHPSSVNSRRREMGGPEEPSASFHPAEKRLYAFGEKSRSVQPGNANAGITSLRSVTRLDPMTYMLFGAYEVYATGRGLECDGWLPVTGNLHALDDVQRLKSYLDTCMLRVFEGLSKALSRERDTRSQANRNAVDVRSGSSRIRERTVDLDDSKENESEDEDDMPSMSEHARLQNELARRQTRKIEPLSGDEIRELGMLTTDVVRILDAYADEREGARSTYSSRPATPVNPNVYRPPGARGGGGMRW
ncbi:hypothetical protein CcaverHIS002_0409620 [Cutaneotrichosporon cavernicola]|nr:hypothetical protein CcaverHIS002_0409620 [Cutaneotrichosporon cavernicola]